MKNKLFLIAIFPLFLSADLTNYYQNAIGNSYLLKEAKANLDAKKVAIEKINGKNGFNLSWNGSISRKNDNSENDAYDAIYNDKQYGVTLNKPLYNPNNNLNIDKSNLEYEKELLLYKKTLQQFTQDFLNKYFEIRQLSQSKQLSIKNLNFAKKIYERAEQLKELQLIDNTSFLEVETNLEEAQEQYNLTTLRYNKAYEIFALYTNIEFDKKLSFKSIDNITKLGQDLSKEIESNIDLELIKHDITILKKELGFYQKWYMPNLDFNINYSNLKTGSKENYDIEQLSGTLSVKGTLYPNQEQSASKKETTLLIHSLENQYLGKEKELLIELSYELLELQNHLATIKVLKSKLNKFQYELKVVEQKNKMGLSDITKTLDIQKNIFDIENNIMQSNISAFKTYTSIEMKKNMEFDSIIHKLNEYN
jgi:outer membrane protein TolC